MVSYGAQAAVVTVVTVVVFLLELRVINGIKTRLIRESNDKTPRSTQFAIVHALPFGCLAWTIFVALFAGVAVRVGGGNTRGPSSSATLGTSAWFNVGWSGSTTSFFGVSINTWYAYLLVINYQITRCILGSLLSNIFKPYIITLQSNLLQSSKLDMDIRWLLLAQACVTVFSSFSYLTDIFLYLSQVEVAIVSLAVTLLIDWQSTTALLIGARGKRAGEVFYPPETETLFARKKLDGISI